MGVALGHPHTALRSNALVVIVVSEAIKQLLDDEEQKQRNCENADEDPAGLIKSVFETPIRLSSAGTNRDLENGPDDGGRG